MSPIKVAFTAALVGVVSTVALAADPDSDSGRKERMDRAYEDYRNPNPGPAARAENSMKHGMHRAGYAVKHGAEKVGHAVGKGVRKTGAAVDRGGEKMENASTPKP